MVKTIGSLFSGIGGLDLGLERALGASTIWQVEADLFCRRVLERHWPNTTRHNDVRTARSLPYVDVICGGFPCQDLSLAGRGAGIDGERSGLWREYRRIVDETKPACVVVENVPAIAKRGLAVVVGELANLGFVGMWDVVTAAQLGAPHLRRRIFVVAAHPDRIGIREQPKWDPGRREEVQGRRQAITLDDGEEWPFAEWNGGAPASDVRRMDDGLFLGMDGPGQRRPLDADRFHALGNAVVPQVGEVVGSALLGLVQW